MRPELKCGLTTGTCVSLLLGAGFFFGSHGARLAFGQYGGYISGVVLMAALIPLVQAKQAAAPGGRLKLGQGISAGLFASLVAALLICGTFFAYNRYINPYWLDNALDWQVARMRAEGTTEIEIRQEITFYRRSCSPAGFIATTLLAMTLMSGFFSLALTLYLRPRSGAPPA